MAPLKNPCHEKFLREYIRLGNQTRAWQLAFPTVRFKPRHAQAASSRAMRYPYIQARYQELVERHMRRQDISIEKILTDYQWAIEAAKSQGKAGDVVSAAREQARLVGLLRDRIETGGVGDFDSVTEISTILEMVEKEAGPEAALALAKAFNLVKDAPQEPDDQQLVEAKPASDAVN